MTQLFLLVDLFLIDLVFVHIYMGLWMMNASYKQSYRLVLFTIEMLQNRVTLILDSVFQKYFFRNVFEMYRLSHLPQFGYT